MPPRPFVLLPAIACLLLLPSCSSREAQVPVEPAPAAEPTPPRDVAPRPPLEAPPPIQSAETPPAGQVARKEFDMNDPPAWYREMERNYDTAVAALARGKKEEAISLLDQVLASQSTHKGAAILKSRTLRELGRPAEGVHDLEAAIDRRPTDESLLEELAAVRLALGEPAKALDAVARALTRDGAVPGARYIRAVALAELDDMQGALAALEDALRHGFVDLATLEKETRFEPIREEPRFREVVAAMEDFRRAVEAAKR